MSLRGFGFQTLTDGTPQPCFGTRVTSPIVISPDRNTGRIDVASQPSQAVLAVAANIFRVGDHILLGSSADFGPVNQTPPPAAPDGGVISAINTAANTATVNGLQRRHNASEWAVLALPVGQAVIQNGNALINIGEDSSDSAASATLIAQVQATGVYVLGSPSLGNVVETQHIWIQGTGGQQYLPSLLTI